MVENTGERSRGRHRESECEMQNMWRKRHKSSNMRGIQKEKTKVTSSATHKWRRKSDKNNNNNKSI